MNIVNSEQTPFVLLQSIENRCRGLSVELPKIEEAKAQWSGIGFTVGTIKLVTPLGQVQEILSNPEFSKVPGAKDWVRGICNNRGSLLPIIDLSRFLGVGVVPKGRRNRVLVIRFGSLISGLLVDEVKGQRHFDYDQEIQIPENCDDAVLEFLEGAYAKDGEIWLLFNMRKLVETQSFLNAAV